MPSLSRTERALRFRRWASSALLVLATLAVAGLVAFLFVNPPGSKQRSTTPISTDLVTPSASPVVVSSTASPSAVASTSTTVSEVTTTAAASTGG